MTIKTLLSLTVICLSAAILQAQETEAPKSHFSGTVDFATKSAYLGRADTLNYQYLNASLGYHFKSGIFVNGDMSFTPNAPTKFESSSLQLGFEHALVPDVLAGSLSYSRYFYSSSSQQIQSETQGSFTAGLSADLDWLSLSMDADYNHGSKHDLLLSWEASGQINLLPIGDDTVRFSPTITAYAGTQNLFYEKHLKAKKVNQLNKALAAAYSEFRMLDIDLSLPVSYTLNRVTFTLSPVISIPYNLIEPIRFIPHPFYLDLTVTVDL